MSQKNIDDPERWAKHSGSMKTDGVGDAVKVYPNTPPTGSQYRTRSASCVTMPEPPLGVSRGRWIIKPMKVAQARRWVGRYNNWIADWNFAEVIPGLPLSPKWPEAVFTYGPQIGLPDNTLAFELRNGGRIGIIHLQDWWPFHDGWSFKRHSARIDQIIWAGWLQLNRKHGGRNDG